MLTIDWPFVEKLTSSDVMPVLRRANLSIFITLNDLDHVGLSPGFC